MSKAVRNTLIVLAVLLGAGALVATGFAYGRATAWQSMMDGGYGMMGDGYGMPALSPAEGMGGNYGGMMDGSYAPGDVEPLSVDEARQAVEKYLAGQDGLAIEEIMVFDNNAYAIIAEEDTGIGAFELLVDPVTRAVFPEYGPNMMWNLKYGMHANGYEGMMGGGYGMMGGGYGMMGGNYGDMHAPSNVEGMGDGYAGEGTPPEVSAEMPVSPEDALQAAQRFLDQYAPGVQVSDEITAFYGYYTIDTQKDGQIVGMLSVNGFTGQVFPHTWHGDFITMQEYE